ncbi:MAG TPA: response regulator [Candidatus Binatia bacterium]|jgi:CheY-like chemotaxis protein|nr:response regulator [Candidatus Binatia bacterium]
MHILLVEDNPADAFLTQEALGQGTVNNGKVSVVMDGQEALSFLRQEGKYASARRPDLILLDLNLPKVDGRAVLAAIKTDPLLKHIPVVIFTSSAAPRDILQAYALYANCYVIKPLDLDNFFQVVRSVVQFWAMTACLPSRVTGDP